MMAVKNELKYYMNLSDGDILNAFVQLHDLKTEIIVNSSTDTKSSSNFCSNSLSNSSNSTDSAISVSPTNKLFQSNEASKFYEKASFNKSYDSTSTEAFENLNIISSMFDIFEDFKECWRAQGHSLNHKVYEDAENIISVTIQSERLQKINVVIDHLKEVSEKFRKLKQLLRSCDQTDSLKSHVQYHRHILNFFGFANNIMKDVAKDLVALEDSCPASHRDLAYSEFSKKVFLLTSEIHKSMDRLKEFEGYVRSPEINNIADCF
ncbi:uncharacterized protein [Parasteatoda tepidariorum]|uniref:uncharacterized protein isoform X1 n=2 Tax=Parasteatoda tepidariorum TaxID=114398 RepID=UPI00077FA0C8|nr:uncharacterized protein LOC107444549 isoform X1 [Parasteatoda tepidariorum]